jgi:hypothetical protein
MSRSGERVIAALLDAALIPRHDPVLHAGVGGWEVDQVEVQVPGHEVGRDLGGGAGDGEDGRNRLQLHECFLESVEDVRGGVGRRADAPAVPRCG